MPRQIAQAPAEPLGTAQTGTTGANVTNEGYDRGYPRLLIREYEESDAEAAFEIYGDAVVMEFIGPKDATATVAQQREKLIAVRTKHAAFGDPLGAGRSSSCSNWSVLTSQHHARAIAYDEPAP